jgi:hypothetical protein
MPKLICTFTLKLRSQPAAAEDALIVFREIMLDRGEA